jgi:hypothetical protein
MSQKTEGKPVACPRCGSAHFQKAVFRQYLGGSPGGELHETAYPASAGPKSKVGRNPRQPRDTDSAYDA